MIRPAFFRLHMAWLQSCNGQCFSQIFAYYALRKAEFLQHHRRSHRRSPIFTSMENFKGVENSRLLVVRFCRPEAIICRTRRANLD